MRVQVVNRIMADQSQRKYSTLSVEHILRCERVQEVIKVRASVVLCAAHVGWLSARARAVAWSTSGTRRGQES